MSPLFVVLFQWILVAKVITVLQSLSWIIALFFISSYCLPFLVEQRSSLGWSITTQQWTVLVEQTAFLSVFLSFHFFNQFLLSPLLPLLPHCTVWTCDSSLSVCPPYSNEGWEGWPQAFILASEVQQQACMEAQGGKGSLPQWFIWTFPPFEMASQGPCMINVTTLIYSVLDRVPAEYLKTRNFSERLWAGLGISWFDWKSACYWTFPIVHVDLISCTQVNTPTN